MEICDKRMEARVINLEEMQVFLDQFRIRHPLTGLFLTFIIELFYQNKIM